MPAGVIRFFNFERGFGFVSPDDGLDDIFVHISAVERSGLVSLTQGDFIEFDVELDRKTGRYIATNLEVIRPVSKPSAQFRDVEEQAS